MGEHDALAPGHPPEQAQLEAKLAEADALAARYLDALRRMTADFENYKQRIIAEREQARESAAADLLEDLLPVLDNFARALQAAGALAGPGASLRTGVEMILGQLTAVLAERGLAPAGATGDPFDPRLHEAVSTMPGEGPHDTVGEVVRRGYTLRGKLLRPAQVVVAKAPQEVQSDE